MTIPHILKFPIKKNPGFYNVIPFPISFEVIDGIALLVLLDKDKKRQQFVIHRETVLNSCVPHNIIPITKTAKIHISIQSFETYQTKQIIADEIIEYRPIEAKRFVSNIYSYYYSVKGQNYFFKGEKHSCWEITYVDTGELITNVDGKEYILKNQNLIIYFPK